MNPKDAKQAKSVHASVLAQSGSSEKAFSLKAFIGISILFIAAWILTS